MAALLDEGVPMDVLEDGPTPAARLRALATLAALPGADRAALATKVRELAHEIGGVESASLDPSWQRVDLGPALRGEAVRVVPSVLRRDDGAALLYAGRVNGAHGESGIGKTWTAGVAAKQELEAGHHVVWIDLEDSEAVVVERLRDVLHVSVRAIEERLHYFRPTAPFDDAALAALEAEIRGLDVSLLVIDSLGEAFGLEGLDEDRDVQVGPWLRRVARRLANAGPAVLLLDHSTKAKDAPLYPSGSKRKRAAITGASYLLEAAEPLTREAGGRLRLLTAKDRHGHYRRGELAATIDMRPYLGRMSVRVWPPSERSEGDAQAASVKVEATARLAVELVRTAGRPLSQRELVARLQGARETRHAGLDHAVAEGLLEIQAGARGARLYVEVKR